MGQDGTCYAVWREGSEPFAHLGACLELSSQLGVTRVVLVLC